MADQPTLKISKYILCFKRRFRIKYSDRLCNSSHIFKPPGETNKDLVTLGNLIESKLEQYFRLLDWCCCLCDASSVNQLNMTSLNSLACSLVQNNYEKIK
jgi:hypothetical protein